jgi:hypothetical protein
LTAHARGGIIGWRAGRDLRGAAARTQAGAVLVRDLRAMTPPDAWYTEGQGRLMDLLHTLVSQLGVSEEQAKGGAGLLFKMAKEKLGADEFGQVERAVPGVDGMMAAAPEPTGAAGALGGLASSLGGIGGGAGQLGALVSLAGGFKSLNLDSGMVAKFLPIVLSFVQSQGGDGVRDLLAKVLT